MSKRFTDTGLYQKAWFRKLPPKIKCLWEWLRNQCDHAGVIEFDPELASFQIGEEVNFESLEYFGERVELLEDSKIWLVDFIEFQVGVKKLKENYNPHKPIFRSLIKHDLLSRVGQGLRELDSSLVNTSSSIIKEYEYEDKKEDKKEKENLLSFSDTQTHPEKPKVKYEDVANIWNTQFPEKPAPFLLSASLNKEFFTTIGYLNTLKQWEDLILKAKSLDWYAKNGWFSIIWILKYDNALKIQQTQNSTPDKAATKKVNLGLIKTVLSRGFKKVADIPESFNLSDLEKDFILNNGGLRSMGQMNEFELQRIAKEAQ